MDSLERHGLQSSESTTGNSQTFVEFSGKWAGAFDAGLLSAADRFRDALAPKLARGYTSGRFTTGRAAESLKVKKPFNGPDGHRETAVFTRDFKQRLWEFGSYNAFTRRFERREFWRETMMEQGEPMAAAFHQAFTRTLG